MRKKNDIVVRKAGEQHEWMHTGNAKHTCITCGVVRVKYPPPAVFYDKHGVKLSENPKCNRNEIIQTS